ncbi:MAG: phosphoadenosine phosphosulfate reductase family protein [Aeromicrobium erythreum]
MTAEGLFSARQVATLTRPQRADRVRRLMDQAYTDLDRAIAEHVDADGRRLVGIVTLFSGGNDSTVLAHLMRPWSTHAAHANTGIGIEATRQFVRDTCATWDLPLLERAAPRPEDSYEAHVLAHGFPGPGMHARIYQRLKERALEQVRRELVTNGYRERVVYLAGRRRSESERRSSIPAVERKDSVVWVSPLVDWTALDMTTYRLMHAESDPVPLNEVPQRIHMSGECLCGCFAKPGEIDELAFWFPETVAYIRDLEARIADLDIPEHRKRWGWSAYPEAAKRRMKEVAVMAGQIDLFAELEPSPAGPLCSDCGPDETGADRG